MAKKKKPIQEMRKAFQQYMDSKQKKGVKDTVILNTKEVKVQHKTETGKIKTKIVTVDDDPQLVECYVCHARIPRQSKGTVYIGKGANYLDGSTDCRVYRCEDCYVGSSSWMKHVGDKSSIYKYYSEKEILV